MWISACVLDAEGLQERHGRLAYWIDVCRRLSAMNNFNGAKCVLSGLEYGPVYRLESTWSVSVTLYFKSYNNRITQLLSRQERQTFEGLREELSPLDNASKYRKRLKKSNAPLLPFLGYHLGDLVYLKEMIRQDVGRGDLEQVKQREQQFLKLIQDLLAMQQKCTYNYQPMPSIQQLIQQQNYYKPQLKNQMEDRNYARSYQLEPKHNPQTLLLLSASSSPTSRSATAPVTVNSASPTSTTNTNDSSDTVQRTDSSSSSNYASTPPSPLLQQSGSAKRHRLFPKYHSFTVSAATASNVLKQTSPPLASPLQSPPQHEQQLQHLKDNARSSARSSLNSIFAAIHKRWGSMHSTHSNDMTIVPISDDSIVNSSNSEDYTNSPIGNSNGETVIVTNSESIKESADETANYSSMSIGRRGLFNRGRSKTVGIVPPK